METNQTGTLEVLNSLLRTELSAIDTYGIALHDRSTFSAKTELSQCQRSHELRADKLRGKIVDLGGSPAERPGITGAWSKVIERGAAAISDDMAIRALEQDEDHVLRDYRSCLARVTPDVRSFLEREVLPEEESTHRTLSDLKHRLASS